MGDIEIEIQVKVDNTRSLVAFLNKKARLIKEETQVDRYYSPAHKNFIEKRPVDEWLRLRETNNGNSITYKNWHHGKNGKSHYCDEYETSIKNIESLKKIFKVLKFKTLAIVDKTRRSWIYKDYEISLDKVEGLGNFVEVEYKGRDKKLNPEKIISEMINFLRQHKVGKIMRNCQGYPFLLMFPKEAKYEEV